MVGRNPPNSYTIRPTDSQDGAYDTEVTPHGVESYGGEVYGGKVYENSRVQCL